MQLPKIKELNIDGARIVPYDLTLGSVLFLQLKITLQISSLSNRGQLRDSLDELATHLSEDLTTALLKLSSANYRCK